MHACSKCGMTFSRTWNLSRHDQQVHRGHSLTERCEPTYQGSGNCEISQWNQDGDGRKYSGAKRSEFLVKNSTQHSDIASEFDNDEDSNESTECDNFQNTPNGDSGDSAEYPEDGDNSESEDSGDSMESGVDGDSEESTEEEEDVEENEDLQNIDPIECHVCECGENIECQCGENDSQTSQQELTSSPQFKSFSYWDYCEMKFYLLWRSKRKIPQVVRHREWLRRIPGLSRKSWKQFIHKSTNDELDTFREISSNLLRGRIPLTKADLNSLTKYRDAIRELALETTSYRKLRWILLAKCNNMIRFLIVISLPTSIKTAESLLI